MTATYLDKLVAKFVRDYYTKQNEQPESLVDLYNPKCHVVHGVEQREPKTARNLTDLQILLTRPSFGKSKILINDLVVCTINSVTVSLLITGEQKKDEAKRPQKFVQNFVLLNSEKGKLVILTDTLKFLSSKKPAGDDKVQNERAQNERAHSDERELKERELKERELKERELRDKELRDKELRDKELRDKELRDKELREKDLKDLKEKELKEKELRDKQVKSEQFKSEQTEREEESSAEKPKHSGSKPLKFNLKSVENSEFVPMRFQTPHSFQIPQQVPVPYYPPNYGMYVPQPLPLISAYLKFSSPEIPQPLIEATLAQCGKFDNLRLDMAKSQGFVDLDQHTYHYLIAAGTLPVMGSTEFSIQIRPRT